MLDNSLKWIPKKGIHLPFQRPCGAKPSPGAEDEEDELVASDRSLSSSREIEGTCWGGDASGVAGATAAVAGGGKGCAIYSGIAM